MNKIYDGDPSREVWQNDLNIPKYVAHLMTLKSCNIEPEDARAVLTVDGETLPVLRVPLVAVGYSDLNTAEDAILSAMGYGEDDLPIKVA